MTPHEKAEKMVAEALHPDDVACVAHESFKYGGDCERDHAGHAKAMLGASPALASALELGVAWQMAEAALPEGETFYFNLDRIVEASGTTTWRAVVSSDLIDRTEEAATPAEALTALAAALEADRA